MDSVLDYHIGHSDKKFEELKIQIEALSEKVDELREFKVQMIATSRLVSLVVSAFSGLITLIVSTVITIKFK
ncbi:MAG TPA: hypothetical protein VJJ83_05495 [Candidatus Babeliales bacterium]|nr:hypothetical protein [Candidatus Babeliales bacterium]